MKKRTWDLLDEFNRLNAPIVDKMLADGFEDTKKAYAKFGMTFKPKTVEEYRDWLTEQYPMPVPDWMR